jgi:hypothetical protein
MSDPITVRVIDLINGPRAVDAADGELVFKEIFPVIKAGQNVILSFEGITMVITAFLNAAIGKLFGEISEEKFNELLEIRDLREAFQPALEKSLEWSKAYFKNREGMERAILEELGDEE